jgi:hypothetical protein
MEKAMPKTSVIFSLLFAVSSTAFAETTATEKMNEKYGEQRPHHFNPISDAYAMVQLHKAVAKKADFKLEMDAQLTQLRPQHFNPKSDAYLQTH